MSAPTSRGQDREAALVVQLAACISLLSFFYYFQHGEILLYGDAVAHINIARRVFDSRTPGLLQLGTVWLPLPHLLMLPFIISRWAWQTGLGGSIPSLVSFIFGTWGIFRLVRGALRPLSASLASPAAWIAAIVYMANPNLIYLQTTAMTEPVYLAFFIWAVVYFGEFVLASRSGQTGSAELLKCGLCLAATCLTRYDGWFLAAITGAAALAVFLRSKPGKPANWRGFTQFALVAVAAPVLWITYNAVVYRNPLEFANGPYSAKAIERRTSTPGSAPHPGTRNLPEAATYFLKAGELTMLESNWHRLWVALLLIGILGILVLERHLWPLLLLLSPLPFYMMSIAYSGVPIFLPSWWPYSIYNARYGVQLLPAFAVFSGVAMFFVMRPLSSLRPRATVAGAMLLLVAVGYAMVWYKQPISFREGWINSRTRTAFETALAREIIKLPPNSTILMYLGDHVGALQQAGIPLRRVINEGNHRTWKQPVDPDGLWEKTLANPGQYADFVIAMQGDAVDTGVNKQNLNALSIIHVTGQPAATIYKAR